MKKILKIDSDKGKSVLVLVCFLVVSSLFFYKNLESNLKGFYANRNFLGEIKITGFSWAEKDSANQVGICFWSKASLSL